MRKLMFLALLACLTLPAGTHAARPGSSVFSDGSDWRILHNRPLHLPRLTLGQPCPPTHGHDLKQAGIGGIGNGPVYVAYGNGNILPLYPSMYDPTAGVYYLKSAWAASPSYRGPALVRGRRIDDSVRVQYRITFDYADAGSLGNRYEPTELWFPRHTSITAEGSTHGWRYETSRASIQGPGCYAYQIDGLGFSNVIFLQVGEDTQAVGLVRTLFDSLDAHDAKGVLSTFEGGVHPDFTPYGWADQTGADGRGAGKLHQVTGKQHLRVYLRHIIEGNPHYRHVKVAVFTGGDGNPGTATAQATFSFSSHWVDHGKVHVVSAKIPLVYDEATSEWKVQFVLFGPPRGSVPLHLPHTGGGGQAR